MIVTFKDKNQLEYISNFVNLVFDVYDKSAVNTIYSLSRTLSNLLAKIREKPDTELKLVFTTRPGGINPDQDQLYCLYNICNVLNNIGADEVNAGIDMYNALNSHYVKSDIPWFLEMLKQYNVPAEYCFDLFRDWCSREGKAVLAEDCMSIQAKHNITMTPVWNWVYFNEPSPGIEWTKEVLRYKEIINGRA